MKTNKLFLSACLMLFSLAANAATVVYQAEDKTGGLNAHVNTNQAGFNGTGFVEMDNANGNYFEWNNVTAAAASTADIRFRYTNSDGSQVARSCDIIVNGTNAGSYIFPWVNGGWAAWTYSTQVMTVNLNAGNNTIRVQINNPNGGTGKSPKVDEMEVVIGTPTVINVTSVSADPSNLALFVAQTAEMKATVLPANATDKSVSWESDNTNVATIDAGTGFATAVAEGTATFTATSTNGGIKGTCTVRVYPSNVTTGANPNLILNPGFEEGATIWANWGNFAATTDPTLVATGTQAGFVSSGTAGGFAQDINLPVGGAGKTYLFSVKMKTTGTPASAQTGVDVYESSTKLNSPYYKTIENADVAYTTYQYVVATTAATTKFQVWVWKNATGAVYLDDYSLAELDNISTSLKNNNSSEFRLTQHSNQQILSLKFDTMMKAAMVSITDLNGKRLYQSNVTDASELTIPTANFAKGIYILSVVNNNLSINQKFVMQ